MLKYQAGAFPGSPVGPGCMCAFAMYDIPNVKITGYDVVSNRPKVAAYRAPGAPNSSFGVESCLDELADQLGIDPLALREKNAAKDGTKAAHGPTWSNIGYHRRRSKRPSTTRTMKARSGPTRAAASPSGFWFNVGGEFERGGAHQRGRHGQRRLRQPRYRRLARLDGDDGGRGAWHPVERVRPIVADTARSASRS